MANRKTCRIPKKSKCECEGERRGIEKNRRTAGRHCKNKSVPPSCPPRQLLPPAPDLETLGWVCKLFLSALNIWPPCPVPAIKHRQKHNKREPATSAKTNKQASACPKGSSFQNTRVCFQAVRLSVSVFTTSFLCWIDVMWRTVGLNMMCKYTLESPRTIYQPYIYLWTFVGVHIPRFIRLAPATLCFYMACWDIQLCLVCDSSAKVFIR